jgi:hypothetical protein
MLRAVIRFIIAGVLLCASATSHADAVTDRAKALLERQDAKAAYDLLLPLEPQRAGDPLYDYLLGIAALDAGDPERGVFALERVLAQQPDNALARAEIARAYYVLGQTEAARQEFETVRKAAIPEDAKATVDRFLSAIAAGEGTRIDGYAEVSVGYDSNVSSAVATSQIAIPAFGGAAFTLDPSLRERGDQFVNLAGGVNFTRKLNQAWSLVGGGAAYMRVNTDATQFNTNTLDATLGVRYRRGLEAFTLGAQGQYFGVDGGRYRNAVGAVGQWQHAFDEHTQATLFGQFVQLRYESQPVRDADRSVLGLAFAHAFQGGYAPAIFASVYGGEEKAVDPNFPHLGHKPVGVRMGGQLRLGGGWSAYGSASYERRKYEGTEPLFLAVREDKQTDVIAGVSYLWRPRTTVFGQVSYTDNSSTIPLNDFDRTITSVGVRFSF